jgi:hTAFII28-like protein conserved region
VSPLRRVLTDMTDCSHLMSAMTEEQYDRHEAYRRARLQRAAVKRVSGASSFSDDHCLQLCCLQLVNHCLAQSVNDNVGMVVSGIGKVFVGEIVEMGEWPHRLLASRRVAYRSTHFLISSARSDEGERRRRPAGPTRASSRSSPAIQASKRKARVLPNRRHFRSPRSRQEAQALLEGSKTTCCDAMFIV